MVEQIAERTVRGILLDCIKQHGPITEVNIDSATKRLVGQLAGLDTESYWRRRYQHLRHAYKRLMDPSQVHKNAS